jgi:archaellin
VTVTKAPGADDIQLTNVTYQFVTSDQVVTDVMNATKANGSTSGQTSQIGNITSETPGDVITDRSDRYVLNFSTTNEFGSTLQGGEQITLTLTTAPGASTVTELRVPDSLVDRNAVTL